MATRAIIMGERKRIALIAHDNRKADLLDWARDNRGGLGAHELLATGTTGRLLSAELKLAVRCYRSGPLGGDQQIGASPWSTISRLPAIGRPPTSCSPHR